MTAFLYQRSLIKRSSHRFSAAAGQVASGERFRTRNADDGVDLVAARDRVSDLSKIVSGYQRRWHRRSARDYPAPGLSRWHWASMRSGCRRSFRHRWRTSDMTSSDYTDIDPIFGTLADFDALVAAVHGRGLRIILDYVPNHSSDQHPWFLDSRSGRASAKRDWYMWHDPAPDGGPPNNWLSHFGGSAWEWDRVYGSILLSLLPAAAAGPELAQSAGAGGHASMCCASGSTAASTASASMCMWLLIKDDQFRDNPVESDLAAGSIRRMRGCCRSIRLTGRRCTRWWRRLREMIDHYPESSSDWRDLPAGRPRW